MFKKIIKYSLLSFLLFLSGFYNFSYSLTLRKVTIQKFIKRTQLAVWATLIKAEAKNRKTLLTFRIDNTLKGKKYKKIIVHAGGRYESVPTHINGWYFLALRKNNKGHWKQVMLRGIWFVKYLLKPNYKGFYSVQVPRGLIRGIPRSLKKTQKIIYLLPNGKYHPLQVTYYPYYDVKKYLKSIFQ